MAEGCQSKSFEPVAILLEICSEEPSSACSQQAGHGLEELARADSGSAADDSENSE